MQIAICSYPEFLEQAHFWLNYRVGGDSGIRTMIGHLTVTTLRYSDQVIPKSHKVYTLPLSASGMIPEWSEGHFSLTWPWFLPPFFWSNIVPLVTPRDHKVKLNPERLVWWTNIYGRFVMCQELHFTYIQTYLVLFNLHSSMEWGTDTIPDLHLRKLRGKIMKLPNFMQLVSVGLVSESQ